MAPMRHCLVLPWHRCTTARCCHGTDASLLGAAMAPMHHCRHDIRSYQLIRFSSPFTCGTARAKRRSNLSVTNSSIPCHYQLQQQVTCAFRVYVCRVGSSYCQSHTVSSMPCMTFVVILSHTSLHLRIPCQYTSITNTTPTPHQVCTDSACIASPCLPVQTPHWRVRERGAGRAGGGGCAHDARRTMCRRSFVRSFFRVQVCGLSTGEGVTMAVTVTEVWPGPRTLLPPAWTRRSPGERQ